MLFDIRARGQRRGVGLGMIDGAQLFAVLAHAAHGFDLPFGVEREAEFFVVGSIDDGITFPETTSVAGAEAADLFFRRFLRELQQLVDDAPREADSAHVSPHTGHAGSLRNRISRHSILSASNSSSRPASVWP